jgi:transposase
MSTGVRTSMVSTKGTGSVIVVGSDAHKRSYMCQAVGGATGELRGSETVKATSAGHGRLLAWARRLDGERVWAIEDCRNVSGKLERFLLARGERVVRVAPRLIKHPPRS